jgi:hypothetical protein
MAVHEMLSNFTGGEITPLFDARLDHQKYNTSCRELENMRVLPFGGVRMRSGTVSLYDLDILPSSLRTFQYSTEVGYILAFIFFQLYIFDEFGELVQYIGTAPYNSLPDDNEAAVVQTIQINDVMYLAHPDHPVYKLSRVTPTTFTLAPVVWKYPALLDENTGATTLAVGALSGSTTLTSSVAQFDSSHVGSYWEIRHLRDATSDTLDISDSAGTTNGTALEVVGDWTMTTSQYWYGTLQVQRSTDGGSTWKVAREVKSKGQRNTVISGTELVPNIGSPRIKLRLSYTATGDPFGAAVWTGTAPTTYVKATAVLEVSDSYVAGLVKATAFVSSTVLTVTVVIPPAATTATLIWSEGAWSAYRGYPRAVGLFESRVFYAGTTYRPNTVWGSQTGDFENFQYSDLDDAGIALQFAASEQNTIQWLASQTMLDGATSGNEFALRSGNDNEPLTPSNGVVKGGTSYGAEYRTALKIGSAIIFVQRQGLRIRELREPSFYADPGADNTTDLTLLAAHITGPGIVQMAFAALPDPTLYCVRSDGVLAVLTYNREQNVIAWSRWTTAGGNIVSVATLYGATSDKVFLCVQRGRDETDDQKFYLEGFTTELQDATEGTFLDAAYRWDDGSPHTSFVMPDVHFNDLLDQCKVVADGCVLSEDDFDVTADPDIGPTGQTTLVLAQAATVVVIGLPYTGILKPMKVDIQMANGTSQGRKRRISEVVARFSESLGCTYGNSTTNDPANGLYAAELPFRSTSDNMDEPVPLFTGDKQILPWDGGGNDLNGDIVISQQQPLPMTVLGLFVKFDVMGS